MSSPGTVTDLLVASKGGEAEAPTKPVPLVQEELQRAAQRCQRERQGPSGDRRDLDLILLELNGLTARDASQARTVELQRCVAKAWLYRKMTRR